MKILMISDLHLNDVSEEYMKKVFRRINKMFEVINKEILPSEDLVVVMCGDVVHKGDAQYYESAKEMFEYLKGKFETRKVEYVMVPGNHDICNNSFADFDKFNLLYCDKIGEFESKNCWSKNIGDLNFIMANSAYHKDTEYGKVDADMIEKNSNQSIDNILVTHHSIMSEDDGDKAVIRNAPRLIDAINKNRIIFHLHGHTHGTFITKVGYECSSLGVGSMLFEAREMVSQFNLISLSNNKIISATNYIYLVDRDKYIPVDIELENKAEFLQTNEVKTNNMFQQPHNYIPRLVGPFDVVRGGTISLYYNRELLKPLYEIVTENVRVALIGEAGNGKSYELINLAYEIEKNKYAIPIYVKLNDYVDESIEDLIEFNEDEIISGNYVLIFDGYDEIEESNLNKFARKLNKFTQKHPNQKIVVSTRNNFYKMSEDNMKASTFYDFFECSLCYLKNKDIDYFLERKNIENKEQFWHEVKSKQLNDQIKVPFFLAKIVDLFIEKEKLPKQNEIMNQLILSRFEKDKSKYINTKDIEEQKREIMMLLKRLAFSMQCLRKNTISLDEYQEFMDTEDRKLIRYSGIWGKNGEDKWEFEHNNFREYLAAEYMNKLPLDEIKNLMTYKGEKNQIKESWINVLSFLVMIYPERALVDWIIDVEPSLAVKFELSRLSDDLRTRIFCCIMDRYKVANMWISRERNDEEKLARFGQSEKSIEYLIKEIQKPIHFRAQSNAINILGKMTNYFGKEEVIRRVLFECCSDEKTGKYQIASAIMALMNIRLFSKEDIDKLIMLFQNENDSNIRYALYCYILENNLQDYSIDYVLSGIKMSSNKYWDNYSESKRLEDIIQSLKEYDSIIKIFEYIGGAKEYHSIALFFEDTLDEICKKAIEFYNHGKEEILLYIQKLYYKSAVNFETKTNKVLKETLESIGKIFSTYKWILNEHYPGDQNAYFVLEELMDEQCLDDLSQKYINNELKNDDVFILYVQRCRKNSYRYDEFKELIRQKDGIIIKEREIIDYETTRYMGRQSYFNALFDKKLFQQLLNELAEMYNGIDTEYEEIKLMSFQRTQKRYDLDKVKWAIENDTFSDRKIVNFISQVNWEIFSISKIYNELSKGEKVKVSEEQKNYIVKYCLKTINNINFSKEVHYKKDGSISYSWECLWCAFFSEYFSIEYEENTLIEMFDLPSFFFGEKNVHDVFPNYVIQRLGKDKIKNQVIYNLNSKILEGNLAETYIKYCDKYRMEDAYELADSVIKDSEYSEWIRRQALEYIVNIKGHDFVIQKYLDGADNALRDVMIETLYVYKDIRITNKMIEINKESEDGLTYLKLIILSESQYGLQRYYELAKEKEQIPDLGDDLSISEITEAIGKIEDVNNLNIVENLLMLSCCENFRDKSYFGLRNSAYKAIKNMGQNDAEFVVAHLEQRIAKNGDKLEFIGVCNQLMYDIKLDTYNQKDIPWTLDEVKQYLDNKK